MAVLLLAETNAGELATDLTAKAVAAARQIGEITVLCASSGCDSAAQEAAGLEGVTKVLCANADIYGHDLAEPVSELLVALAPEYDHIVAPATTSAQNILPRTAALLDVMMISDITAIIDEQTFERPIYAGNAMQTVKSSDSTKIVTIRTASFDAAARHLRFGTDRKRQPGE